MSADGFNKYRAAVQVLQRGRDLFVEAMVDDVLAQGEEFLENNFLFNEFLENQGTRLHFLTLVLGQLEQSADAFDEAMVAEKRLPPRPKPDAGPAKKRRPRTKKMPQKAPTEGTAEDL